MLEEGIFDIHCHIVPGVDDGAADIEETRKLLEMEYKQGVRNIILTPHFRFQMFETPLEKVQRQFWLAEEAAADISKDLHLYLGCEFHANMEMLPMLRVASTSSLIPSRSPSVRRAATWSSTRPTALRPSPTMVSPSPPASDFCKERQPQAETAAAAENGHGFSRLQPVSASDGSAKRYGRSHPRA